LAALELFSSSPKSDPAAEALWKRLTVPYAHEPFTKLAASGSVTGTIEPDPFAARNGLMLDQPLRLPRAGAELVGPTAADVGSATHLFLEHLDLARPGKVEDLRRQFESFVESKLLPTNLAAHVDLDAITWFMTTELGALVCKHAKDVRREVPIHFPREILPGSNGLDRVMMRGRVDMLLPLRDRVIVVDFKTDQVDAPNAAARVQAYREQIATYRNAIAAMLGRQSVESWLVFLKLRRLERLEEAERPGHLR
jgi:ATP-dependent helicase/nuclease subunit A